MNNSRCVPCVVHVMRPWPEPGLDNNGGSLLHRIHAENDNCGSHSIDFSFRELLLSKSFQSEFYANGRQMTSRKKTGGETTNS